MIGLKKEDVPALIDDVLQAYGQMISPISDVRSTKDYRRDVALGVLRDLIEKDLI